MVLAGVSSTSDTSVTSVLLGMVSFLKLFFGNRTEFQTCGGLGHRNWLTGLRRDLFDDHVLTFAGQALFFDMGEGRWEHRLDLGPLCGLCRSTLGLQAGSNIVLGRLPNGQASPKEQSEKGCESKKGPADGRVEGKHRTLVLVVRGRG